MKMGIPVYELISDCIHNHAEKQLGKDPAVLRLGVLIFHQLMKEAHSTMPYTALHVDVDRRYFHGIPLHVDSKLEQMEIKCIGSAE